MGLKKIDFSDVIFESAVGVLKATTILKAKSEDIFKNSECFDKMLIFSSEIISELFGVKDNTIVLNAVEPETIKETIIMDLCSKYYSICEKYQKDNDITPTDDTEKIIITGLKLMQYNLNLQLQLQEMFGINNIETLGHIENFTIDIINCSLGINKELFIDFCDFFNISDKKGFCKKDIKILHNSCLEYQRKEKEKIRKEENEALELN